VGIPRQDDPVRLMEPVETIRLGVVAHLWVDVFDGGMGRTVER